MTKQNTSDKKKEEIVEDLETQTENIKDEVVEHNDERDERIAQLEDQLKRAVADYRNLERRSVEERIEAVKFANKNFAAALLPAFDTLIMAGKYTQDESVKLTLTHLFEVLKNNGIEKVITNNAQYNAETMEVVEVVEGEENKVIEEIRPGFIINGKLIRPAQVKVGKINK